MNNKKMVECNIEYDSGSSEEDKEFDNDEVLEVINRVLKALQLPSTNSAQEARSAIN